MSARSGLVAWAATVCALLLTLHPVTIGAALVLLVALASRCGLRVLVRLSLVTGLMLALLNPFVATYGDDVVATVAGFELTLQELETGALMGARLAAVILSVSFLALVSPQSMFLATMRTGLRSALLGALVARMRSQLAADIQRARADLRARGRRLDSGSRAERVRSLQQLFGMVVEAGLERAFAAAASLQVRGYGSSCATTDALNGSAASRPPGTGVLAAGFAVGAAAITVVAGGGSMPVVAGTGPDGGAAVLAAFGLAAACVSVLGAAGAARDVDETWTIDSDAGSQVPEPLAAVSAGPAVHLATVRATYPGASEPSLLVADLQVEHCEFVLVSGDSGSGKSTLLDVISGLMPHGTGGRLDGHVEVAGVAQPPPGLVAAVFQDPESQIVLPTVAEEVALVCRNLGLPVEEIRRRVASTLDVLGIAALAGRRTDSLSGGELQRVALAGAVAARPAILVLDEPTSQLDADGSARFWHAVRELRERYGTTVLAAEHRLEAPLGIADRVVRVENGYAAAYSFAEVAAIGTPTHLPAAGLPAPAGRARLAVDRMDVRTPGGRTLVEALELRLRPGTVLCVQGANGCGKSTLLRTLRGLESESMVAVDGVHVRHAERHADQFAFVGQHASSFVFGNSLHQVAGDMLSVPERQRLVPELLIDAGLAHLANRHPSQASVGQRQRLAVVAATAHRPAVWLLDEPTHGLDLRGRRWLAGLVARHALHGGVVVLATHEIDFARALATHWLSLDGDGGWDLRAADDDTHRDIGRHA